MTAGREFKCSIQLPSDPKLLVSGQHFVIITLGSGFYIVDVSRHGTFIIRDGVRKQLPKYPLKAPWPDSALPQKKDMVGIKVGDILQLGCGNSVLGPMGQAVMAVYSGAEYVVLAGEGQCGTGERSEGEKSGKKKRKNIEEAEKCDEPGQKSAAAMRRNEESNARRKYSKQSGALNRFSGACRNIAAQQSSGNRAKNTKFHIKNKRAMKNLVFHVHNNFKRGESAGKGKGGKGNGGKGKGGKGQWGRS